MPLVKIFALNTLRKPVPLKELQSSLCRIWGTKPNTTKLMLTRCDEMTNDEFNEGSFSLIITNYIISHVYLSRCLCRYSSLRETRTYKVNFKMTLIIICCSIFHVVLDFHCFYCFREMVLSGMEDVASAFKEKGLIANVRLETYEGEKYFHLPPSK